MKSRNTLNLIFSIPVWANFICGIGCGKSDSYPQCDFYVRTSGEQKEKWMTAVSKGFGSEVTLINIYIYLVQTKLEAHVSRALCF